MRKRRIDWTSAITWLVVSIGCGVLWWWVLSFIPNGTITAQGAGQPCNWNSDCGYNEVCVPVKRGWGTPRMCVEKPDEQSRTDLIETSGDA